MLTRKIKDFLIRQTVGNSASFCDEKRKSKMYRLSFAFFRKKVKKTVQGIKSIFFKNKFRVAISCILLIAFVLTTISVGTNTNIVAVGAKRFLNGLGIYTEAVSNVEIEDSNYDDPGTWHIDKSAKWTGSGTAKVTFDLSSVMKTGENKKDVILVLDISGSMSGDKMEKMRSDAKELIRYLLSDSSNRIALITFEDTATIVSEFSNDMNDLLEKMDALTVTGSTNYNAALLNVDQIMSGYQKEPNRDVVTLFLTDGYPNIDTPNQIGTYAVLKDKYPYMAINGVQYEMGTEIVDDIKDITDAQWTADQSTLHNVLFDASVSPLVYETFTITDYIHPDYFYINSVNDIKVSLGTVSLEEENGVQKVIWNLDGLYMTGGNATMEINLTMKEQYVGTEGFYPTNQQEEIVSALPSEERQTIQSDQTPVLKNSYQVIYDVNAPEGCTIDAIDPETHFVYQNVTKKTDELSCDGYLFKGWEIDEEDSKDIQMVNDDIFVMPEHDVTIRGTWTRQSIVKSMDGTVYEKTTLYKVLQKAAEEGTLALEYTGSHQDSFDASGTQPIYYFNAGNVTEAAEIQDQNNVLFANMCWKMVRTTDTGGVKLIYNGEPDEFGSCGTDRGTHVGYGSRTSQSMNGNYYYGTSYNYDSDTKTFSLDGELEQAAWNATVGPTLIGKYTCKSTTEDGTCSTLYYIESYSSTSSAYVLPLNSNSQYSQFGTVEFNDNYTSPADVGYMYNTRYTYNSRNMTTAELMLSSTSLSTNYWYADDAVYGTPTANRYNLVNPYQVASTTDYPSLKGKYTFRNATESHTWSSVYYIADVNNTTMYYISLSSGNNVDYYNYSYTFGDSFTDNGDGTYTINNPATIQRVDWYQNYSSMDSKYVCKNAVDNTCSDLWYVTSTGATSFSYIKPINIYKYGNNFTYENGTYKLNDEGSVMFWNMDDSSNRTLLNNAHYTCFNESGECTTLYYIYYVSGTTPYYIQLNDGKNVSDALDEMLTADDVNTTNSTMKNAVDAWYERYLLNYTDYLEDTIFCNDRSIRSLNGWNPNGGSVSSSLQFKEYNVTSDLSCANITDQFSTQNEKAKLTYPVGLMTSPEMNLLGNDDLRETGKWYWLASPSYFYNSDAYGHDVGSSGDLGYGSVGYVYGVRPAVSLKPGTEYSSGNGSMESPYVVALNN